MVLKNYKINVKLELVFIILELFLPKINVDRLCIINYNYFQIN